jgi:putative SOS response-associated peptidase YedK
MCYSAQIEESYAKYLRMTGAEMDIHQFMEIFGVRARDPAIRIPRAVDRWFDNPLTAEAQALQGMVKAYKTAKASDLEQEIFTQKRRLADAERKLAVKPTKAALESRRIATDKLARALGNLPLYTGSQPTRLDDRIFPFHYAPLVVSEGGRRVIKLARYHLRKPAEPASIDRKLPALYNCRRDSLDKYWKQQFGHSHAVLLVSSFFENVDQGGRNAVLHFTPRPASTMLVACLFAEWVDPDNGARLLSFGAISDVPPAEIAAAGHDRMIVNLKPENLDAWLNPQGRSGEALQRILSDRQQPYYEHQVLAA